MRPVFSGYYGLLFGFEVCRMCAEAKMAGFCLLPAVFLRTAHCLGRTAAQSVRRPLGNPSGAAEPAVFRLRAALSGRNRASMAESISPLQIGLVPLVYGLQAYPLVFLMETAETSCRSLRVGAVVPMPGRGIPAVFNYMHRRGAA